MCLCVCVYVCACVPILLITVANCSLVYSGKCLLRKHLAEHVNKLSWTDSVVDSSAAERADQRDTVTVFPLNLDHFLLPHSSLNISSVYIYIYT